MNNPIRHLCHLGEHRPHRRHVSPRSRVKGPEPANDPVLLEDRVDRLALICMAMWSLIQSETNLTEDDLLERVKQIDLTDGVADGKITRHVARCGQCDRPVSSRHTRCIYCGSWQLVASAFDTI